MNLEYARLLGRIRGGNTQLHALNLDLVHGDDFGALRLAISSGTRCPIFPWRNINFDFFKPDFAHAPLRSPKRAEVTVQAESAHLDQRRKIGRPWIRQRQPITTDSHHRRLELPKRSDRKPIREMIPVPRPSQTSLRGIGSPWRARTAGSAGQRPTPPLPARRAASPAPQLHAKSTCASELLHAGD